MRTLLFLVAGLLLLSAVLILGKLFSANFAEAPRIATVAFVVLWLVVAATNMWVGVSKAGYPVADEVPAARPAAGSTAIHG